jgi:hypothetical protein
MPSEETISPCQVWHRARRVPNCGLRVNEPAVRVAPLVNPGLALRRAWVPRVSRRHDAELGFLTETGCVARLP